MKRKYILLVIGSAMGLVFTAQAVSATSAPPPTLTGESLQAFDGGGDPRFPGTFVIRGTCNQTSPSNFTFTASGIATGPYPGTFVANGSYTLAPNPNAVPSYANRAITDFSESFTIDSPNGAVTGTKTEASTLPPALGTGLGDVGQCVFDGQRAFAGTGNLPTTYRATINTGSGPSYHDEGASAASLSQYDTTDQSPPGTTFPPHNGSFTEYFLSSLPATTPVLPTSKDQCKNGGWQTFAVFKNQGDCVSFVTTGGNNPPTGS